MEPLNKSDVRNVLCDGVFAHMFATLTGSLFLTDFARHLGMYEFEIGILASMPFIVTTFQLPISFFIFIYRSHILIKSALYDPSCLSVARSLDNRRLRS